MSESISSEQNSLLDFFEGASEEKEEVAAIVVSTIAGAGNTDVFESTTPGWNRRQVESRSVRRGGCSWFDDYLAQTPVYPPQKLRQVFRIPIKLYWYIPDKLMDGEPRLAQQTDCFGRQGHTSHQKILASLRRLATGAVYRDMDDNARVSVESLRASFKLFVSTVLQVFGKQYLNREPTDDELKNILQSFEEHGFPGCCGSVDCMHLHWKICPYQLKGQYKNPHASKLASVSCEAITDHTLYCWSWFAGRCGTNNDITVLANSPFFIDILSGKRKMNVLGGYIVKNTVREWPMYLLCDGIYPKWAIFVGPNHSPMSQKESFFAKQQEATRKDIERLFGCVQCRFKILRREWCE
jgi:Plant transposon protein